MRKVVTYVDVIFSECSKLAKLTKVLQNLIHNMTFGTHFLF